MAAIGGWGEFIGAMVVFFLAHSLPVRPTVRRRITRIAGERGFTILYSLVSLALLAWVIVAAGCAPYLALWAQAPWQNMATGLAMLSACLLLTYSIGKPNPFSFGGAANDRFDPARPGIVRWVRHPILVVLALWSFSHILPNGNLAHVILFGLFGVFSLLGAPIIDAKKRRTLGSAWQEMQDAMRASPGALTWPRRSDWVRFGLGAGLYAVLVTLHPYLFGVSPFG